MSKGTYLSVLDPEETLSLLQELADKVLSCSRREYMPHDLLTYQEVGEFFGIHIKRKDGEDEQAYSKRLNKYRSSRVAKLCNTAFGLKSINIEGVGRRVVYEDLQSYINDKRI